MAPWLAGLVALFLVTGVAGVWLMWTAAGMQMQLNDFYTSQTADQQVSEDTYQTWNTFSQNAYTLQQLSIPLTLGCAVTLFVVLAVLARRWDVARGHAVQTDAADPAEAPPAS